MEIDRKRKTYDRQFKLDAIGLVVNGRRSVAEVARELGIHVNTLHHWKWELDKEGSSAFPGKGNLSPQEEELRRLRRELEEAREDREILKKNPEVHLQNRQVRYRFVETNRDRWEVGRMCRLLSVSRSGFYAWRGRALSARARKIEELVNVIGEVYREGRSEYGSPTVSWVMREKGYRVNHKQIARLMRENGLRSLVCKRFKHTTRRCADRLASPNLLKQNFQTEAPNRVGSRTSPTSARMKAGSI